MHSCLECKNCKIKMRLGILWCKKERWLTAHNKQKKVALQKNEARYPEFIKHRKLFDMAHECAKIGEFEGMDD